MDSLFILIPIALIFTVIAVKLFFWAVDDRQYDDLDKAAYSILLDRDEVSLLDKSDLSETGHTTNSDRKKESRDRPS